MQNSQNPAAAVASFVERLGAEVEAEVNGALANIDGPPAALVGGFAARIRTARSLPVTKTFKQRWNALGHAGEGAVAVFNAMKRVADTRIEAALAADPTLRDVLTDWDIAAKQPTEAETAPAPSPVEPQETKGQSIAPEAVSAANGFAFTLAQTWQDGPGGTHHPLAAKRIVRAADGSESTVQYDNFRTCKFHSVSFGSHEGLAAFYRGSLLSARGSFLMCGAPAPGLDLTIPHRRLSAETHGPDRTIIAAPRAYIVLDIDDAPVPEGMGAPDKLREAAEHVRSRLPAEFRGAKAVAVATSGTGRKGTALARLRLLFLLDQPAALDMLYNYLTGLRVELPFIDPRAALAGQIIYTARPAFEGMDDPISPDQSVFVLDGDERVTLDFSPSAGRGKPKGRALSVADRGLGARKRDDTAKRRHQSDWRAYLAEALGGELGFFEPLTAALGIAARSSPDGDDAIVAHALMAIAEKADPARVAQYDEAWLRAALRSFRDRDALKREARAQERKPDFGETGARAAAPIGNLADEIENRRKNAMKEIFCLRVARDVAAAQDAAGALGEAGGDVYYRGSSTSGVVRIAVENVDPEQVARRAAALESDGVGTDTASGADGRELGVSPVSETEIAADLAQFVRIVVPYRLDEGELSRRTVFDDGLVVWSRPDGKGGMVDVSGWTRAAVLANAHNPQDAAPDAPNVVYVEDPLRKDVKGIAVDALNRGNFDGVFLRTLRGVSAAPILLSDGSPCLEDGVYPTAKGGVYFVKGAARTAAAAEAFSGMTIGEAREIYAGVVDLFPYRDVSDRAGIAAHLLVHQAAAVCGKVPIAAISSPTPGWGKTFFAVVAPKLTTSRDGYLSSVGDAHREGEFEKRLETSLAARAGRSLIFDEAAGVIPNAPLLKTVTSANSETVELREFGKNGANASMTLRIGDGLIIAFCGLNIRPSADMVRRTFMIRLDREAATARGWNAGEAEARLRQLLADPAEQGRFLAAGLLLLSENYRTPLNNGKRGELIGDQTNYREWAHYVRDTATFITGGDALASQAEMRSADPIALRHLTIARALYVLSDGRRTSPKEIATAAFALTDGAATAHAFGGNLRLVHSANTAVAESFIEHLRREAAEELLDALSSHKDGGVRPTPDSVASALGHYCPQWSDHLTIPDETGARFKIRYHTEPGQRRAELRAFKLGGGA